MRKLYGFFILCSVVFSLISCDKDEDFDAGGTNTKELAGEWFVKIYQNGEIFDDTYYKILTYNTSNNDKDSIWIDALTAWPFFVKAPCNISEKSFTPFSFDNIYFLDAYGYNDTISIVGGKVLKGAATTSGGNKSDSIYIDFSSTGMVEYFVNDLGIEISKEGFSIQGYKRTGFFEDEH